MKKRILLVEDEPGLVLALTDLLLNEGYEFETTPDGLAGLSLASEGRFDLVILDVNLPGKNGFDVCRDLRQRGVTTPILMLTARGQIIDKVLGLKLGADDYLTKPFDSLELLARVEARLRTAPSVAASSSSESFHFGAIAVNFPSTEVRRHGQAVELSAREFELLRFFIERPGITLSRQQLLQEVWGYASDIETRTVDVHVGWLRQKLEDDAKNPRHFLTVRGFGYKFLAQAE
ncbi:MAG: response regulator transcription factor [Acidobacteria bacterium]|nr:response regulator transcription factor [Acidobacteriota bacterium]MBI3427792.1 response regulator transcription factor [Acidobacteriota bacterium]